MNWNALHQRAQEKEAFVRHLDSTYGQAIEDKIAGLTGKEKMGGAQLQYMAFVNAELIGKSKEELKKNPAMAMRYSLVRSVGEIAYDEYLLAKGQGLGTADAVKYADNAVNNWLMKGLNENPEEFISSFAQSDKTGDAFINWGGTRLETSMTGHDLGTSGMAFMEKIADSTIIGRLISNAVEGEIGFTQSLRGAAIIENLAGADPMLGKTMQEVSTWVGMATGIVETMAVGLIPGAGAATIPAYVALKGVSQNYSNTYGLRAKPTSGEIIAGAAFDFATSWAGMQIGNKIVDTTMAAMLAPGKSASVRGITKNALFDRYVTIGISSPIINTGMDMAIDYGTANMLTAAGVSLPQNTWDIYRQISPDALVSAFTKRLAMQAGSALARGIKDKALTKNVTGDTSPAFGSRAYTDREFGDIVKGSGLDGTRNKTVFGIQKYIAALGYRMSPGVLNTVDYMVRSNPALHPSNEASPSLINTILEFSKGDESQRASFRSMVIASVLLNERGKIKAAQDVFAGNSAWTAGVAMVLGGVSRQDVREAARISQSRGIDFENALRQIATDSEINAKMILNDDNLDEFVERTSGLIYNLVDANQDLVDKNKDNVAKDLMSFLGDVFVIRATEEDKFSLGSPDVADRIKARLMKRVTDSGQDAREDNKVSLANELTDKIFDTKRNEISKFQDTTYNTVSDSLKDTFLGDVIASERFTFADGSEGFGDIVRRAEQKVALFQQEVEMNRDLISNPLARFNRHIQQSIEDQGMDDIIKDIDMLASKNGVLDVEGINGYFHLKQEIMRIGSHKLIDYANEIVSISNNKTIPDSVKKLPLNDTVYRMAQMSYMMSGYDGIDGIMKEVDGILKKADVSYLKGEIIENKLLKGADTSAWDAIKWATESVSINRYNKSLFYFLADKTESALTGARFDVSETLKRVGDITGTNRPPLSINSLSRLLNALMPGTVVKHGKESDGSYHTYKITINGYEDTYTDDDVDKLLPRVMAQYEMYKSDTSKMPEDTIGLLNKAAGILAQRVLDQEMLREFKSYTELARARSDIWYRIKAEKAIDAANARLREMMGGTDDLQIDKGATIVRGPGAQDQTSDDEIAIKMNIEGNKTKSELFYTRFFRTFDAPYDFNDGSITARKNIVQNLLDPDDPLTRLFGQSGGTIKLTASINGTRHVRTMDSSQVVEEYSLFKSAASKQIMDFITIATMSYGDPNVKVPADQAQFLGDMFDLAKAQVKMDSSGFYKDVKRNIRDELRESGQQFTEQDVVDRADKVIGEVVAQELRKTAIGHRNGVENNLEILRVVNDVQTYSRTLVGVSPHMTKFGPGMLFNMSYSKTIDPAQQDAIVEHMKALGLRFIGTRAAGFENIWAFVPRNVKNDDIARDNALALLEDAGRYYDNNTEGKALVYYRFNEKTGEIDELRQFGGPGGVTANEASALTQNGWKTAYVLSYQDLLNATRSDFRAHIDTVHGQDNINDATYRYMYSIFDKMEGSGIQDVPDSKYGNIYDAEGKPLKVGQLFDERFDIAATPDDVKERLTNSFTRAGKALNELMLGFIGTEQNPLIRLSALSPEARQMSTDLSNVLSMFQIPGTKDVGDFDLGKYGGNIGEIYSTLVRYTSEFGKINASLTPEITSAMTEIKSALDEIGNINDRKLLAHMLASLGGYKHYDTKQDEITDRMVSLRKAINDAAPKKNALYEAYKNDKNALTSEQKLSEIMLAAMTGFRSFGTENMRDLDKRIGAFQLLPTMTFAEARDTVERLRPNDNGRTTIYIDSQPKGIIGTRLDGTYTVSPQMAEILGIRLGGYIGTGQKVVIQYGGSTFKCQINVDSNLKGTTMMLSVHNTKFLSKLAKQKLLERLEQPPMDNAVNPKGIYDTMPRVHLDKDDTIRLVQSISLHSPQRTAIVTSPTNRQSIVRSATLPLQTPDFDAVKFFARTTREYPSGLAKGNALGAAFRQGNEHTNAAMYVPISNQTNIHLADSRSIVGNTLSSQQDKGDAIFFGQDLNSPETAMFNPWRNHTMNADESHAADIGIFNTVGLGLFNIYRMADSYAKQQGTKLGQTKVNVDGTEYEITAVLKEVADHLAAHPAENMAKDRFRVVTNVLLNYLADRGHIVRYTIDEPVRDAQGNTVNQKKQLFFANFERNGLDGPYHTSLAMISEVANTGRQSYFASSDMHASLNNADFDGDNSLWRPVNNGAADKYLRNVSGENLRGAPDIDKLRVLAKDDLRMRQQQSIKLLLNFESDGVYRPMSQQSSEFGTIYGTFFAEEMNILLPLMDAYAAAGVGLKLNDTIKGISDAILEKVKGLDLKIRPEDLDFFFNEYKNVFERHYNDVAVFARTAKDGDIFAQQFHGGMRIRGVYNDISRLGFGKGTYGDYKVVVTVSEESNEKYYALVHNDKKSAGAGVMAIVIRNANDIVLDEEIIKSMAKTITADTTPSNLSRSGASGEGATAQHKQTELYGLLKDAGFNVVRADQLTNMRIIQGDLGMLSQQANSGADAPKNMYQELIYNAYQKDGKFDRERALREHDSCFAQARIASNIMISRLTDNGFQYRGEVQGAIGGEIEGHVTDVVGRKMSQIIREISDATVMKKDTSYYKAVQIANAIWDGTQHTAGPDKGYTSAEISDAISTMRLIPEHIRPPQFTKVIEFVDSAKNNIGAFLINDIAERHASNIWSSRAEDLMNVPIYSKDMQEFDDVLMKTNRIMNIVEEKFFGVSIQGKLASALKTLQDDVLLKLDDKTLAKGRLTQLDLAEAIYQRIQNLPGSSMITREHVMRIVRDLDISVKPNTSDRVVEIDDVLDPMGTKVYDAAAIRALGKSVHNIAKAAQQKDKIKGLVHLTMGGENVTAAKLIAKISAAMNSSDLGKDIVLKQMVSAGLLGTMWGKSAVASLLAAEGLSVKEGKALMEAVGRGSTWEIESEEAYNRIRSLEMYSNKDEKKVFSPALLQPTTQRFIRQPAVFDVGACL